MKNFVGWLAVIALVASYLGVAFFGFFHGYNVEPQSSFWNDDRSVMEMLRDNSTPHSRLDRMKEKHEDVSCRSKLLSCQHERKALKNLQDKSQLEWGRSLEELQECVDRLGE